MLGSLPFAPKPFDVTLVPLTKGARYFVRSGAHTSFIRGFKKKADVDAWFRDLFDRGVMDWRCGAVFRIKGCDRDLVIVNRKGEPQ